MQLLLLLGTFLFDVGQHQLHLLLFLALTLFHHDLACLFSALLHFELFLSLQSFFVLLLTLHAEFVQLFHEVCLLLLLLQHLALLLFLCLLPCVFLLLESFCLFFLLFKLLFDLVLLLVLFLAQLLLVLDHVVVGLVQLTLKGLLPFELHFPVVCLVFQELLLVQTHVSLLLLLLFGLLDALDVVLADLVGEHVVGLLALLKSLLFEHLALFDIFEQFEFLLEVLLDFHQVLLARLVLLLSDDAFVLDRIKHLQFARVNGLDFVDLLHQLLREGGGDFLHGLLVALLLVDLLDPVAQLLALGALLLATLLEGVVLLGVLS